MKIRDACKPRNISKVRVQTPLLVPSFSSVSLSNVNEIHNWIKDYISSASLVSAYDLHYNFIDEDSIWVSDVVFIDSGMYEHENNQNSPKPEWSPIMHKQMIDRLTPMRKVVLINYDEKQSLNQQIDDALKLHSDYPSHAICFLCKPKSNHFEVTDIESLMHKASTLSSFNVIGFTEKELGNSLLKRCTNILAIRKRLDARGLNLPIHIFGCLDPLGILAYFLCGADIFDGLSWLKFGFHNHIAVYNNNYSLLKRHWAESDLSVRNNVLIFNLNELEKLTRNMKKFMKDYDLAIFGLSEEILDEVKALTELAGVQY